MVEKLSDILFDSKFQNAKIFRNGASFIIYFNDRLEAYDYNPRNNLVTPRKNFVNIFDKPENNPVQ